MGMVIYGVWKFFSRASVNYDLIDGKYYLMLNSASIRMNRQIHLADHHGNAGTFLGWGDGTAPGIRVLKMWNGCLISILKGELKASCSLYGTQARPTESFLI